MRVAKAWGGLLLGLCLGACVVPRGAARAQETAADLNVNARFGRMELAAESISPKAREEFFEHRKGWGGHVRIADSEIVGTRATGQDECDVTVRVAWYVIDEGDLHVTTLRQKWHQVVEGDWKLTAEARLDGDIGLLGERVIADPTVEKRKNAQFPTIRLGSGSDAPRSAPEVDD
jgi:hypothetical protein